jgi:uncharacterized protein (UPF0332 family)
VNDVNRERAIADELARSERAIQALEVLAEHGFVNDAVSKLYYALLYLVRALLLTRGLEVRSHEGALRLLGQHFVKDGPLGRGATQLFAKLMKYREESDYNPTFEFAAEDLPALREEVTAVAASVKALLGRMVDDEPPR